MKHHADIDELFKEGIGEADYPHKDAMWARMEQELDKDTDKRRRPFVWLLLPALLLCSTGIYFYSKTTANQLADQSPASASTSVAAANTTADRINSSDATELTVTDNAVNNSGPGSGRDNQPELDKKQVSSKIAVHTSGNTESLTDAGIAGLTEASNDDAASVSLLPDNFRDQSTVSLLPLATGMNNAKNSLQPVIVPMGMMSVKSKDGETKPNKYSMEVLAGSDIFNLNKKVGYYAGLRINRHLDKGTVISAGINYSYNALNEKYRLSTKPVQQQEADAQINSIKMIRVPIYFQRQLPGTKISLMAGLVPSYIIDASVYNVPGSFTGNPNDYRKFTMNDINRLNVLFGAGVKYSPFNRVSFEVSGSYGFTGLVKNSYINQSRVNDNFKNIQAGVVYRIH